MDNSNNNDTEKMITITIKGTDVGIKGKNVNGQDYYVALVALVAHIIPQLNKADDIGAMVSQAKADALDVTQR